MSLAIWLPLNGNVNNQGTSTMNMVVASDGSTLTETGKVTQRCYRNNSYTTGGYVSEEQVNLGQNQSVFAWVKVTTFNSNASLAASIAGQHRYPTNVGMGMTIKYVSSTTGYLSVNTGNGSSRTFNTYCGSTVLLANTWYHLGYTYDGSTIRLYVNGQLDGSHSFTGMVTPADYFMVGGWSFSGSTGNTVYANYKLNGYINDVRAYNHTLSTKEIKDLAKGLSCHYKFNFEDLYQPVQYLKSSGTQYINTGVVDTNNTCIEIKQYTETNTSCYGTTTGLNYTASGTYPGGYFYYYPHGTAGNPITTRLTQVLKQDNNKCYRDGVLVYTYTATTFTDSQSMFLFGRNSNGSLNDAGTTLIYWCKIYESGALIRDYIPCIRKYDGTAGMFDMVSFKFYTNAGSGTFSYPSVTIDTHVIDSSGYGNNATKTNVGVVDSTVMDSIVLGNATITMNGNGYVRLAKELLNGAFTVSVWAKTSSTTTQCLFCDRGGDDTGQGPALFLISGGTVRFDTVNTSCSTIFNWDDKWHLYTATYDGVNRKIYIDGVLKTTVATNSLGELGGVLTFGGSYAPPGSTVPNGNWFYGSIADWRLYSTALSETDVAELYKTKESIDKDGNFYSNEYVENSTKINCSKTSITKCNSFGEGNNKVSMQSSYTLLDYIDQVNPAAGAASQHNRCEIPSVVYNYIEGRVNVTGKGTSGGIMLSKGWWKSWEGSGTATVTMTPSRLTESTWTNVTWDCGQSYTGLWTSGWSDATNYWTPQNLKVAYIKTYNNSKLTGYFIPVKRNRDNALGLFDKVTNTFYPNAGSGSFAEGSTIEKITSINTNKIIEV